MGTAVDYLLEFFITVFSMLTEIFRSFRSLLLSLLFFGGCLFFFIFLIPLSFSSRGGTNWGGILLLILIFPVIGSFAVSRLKYLQYMVTEFFYERADYYLLGKDITYETMGDYGRRYQRKIEEERRRQEEARARMEEELFRQRFEAFLIRQTTTAPVPGTMAVPTIRAATKGLTTVALRKIRSRHWRLGVDVNADKYEIRLAYKKLAKKYHPDLNPDKDTTQVFQEINAANDFLNDENIARYKSMYGKKQ